MATAPEKYDAIDDIYSLPEGKCAELIDGRIYYMAPLTRKHQRIAGEIFTIIVYDDLYINFPEIAELLNR